MLSFSMCSSVVMHDRAKVNIVCLLAHVSSWVKCEVVVTIVNGSWVVKFYHKTPNIDYSKVHDHFPFRGKDVN